jgi:hypothetical protein
MRLTNVPSALRCSCEFIESARPSRVEEIAKARNSLLCPHPRGLRAADRGCRRGKWVVDDGLLMTFESEEAFRNAQYALDLRPPQSACTWTSSTATRRAR